MVATDIAARGIDISDLGHVINYSLPEDPAVYLHRVGRTGRIGKKGTALNLISGRELGTLTTLEKKYGIAFETRQMPSPEEASRMWTERHVRDIQKSASGSVYEGFLGLAGSLKQRPDADDNIAFLLKFFFGHLRMDKVRAAAEAGGEAPKEEPRPRGRDRERSPGDRPPRGDRTERSLGPRERRERPPRRDRPGEGEAPPAEEKPARPPRPSAEPAAPGQVRMWQPRQCRRPRCRGARHGAGGSGSAGGKGPEKRPPADLRLSLRRRRGCPGVRVTHRKDARRRARP